MIFAKAVSTTLILGATLIALSACEKPKGPAERAGQQIDKATEAAGQQIEKAGQSIQDAANGVKK